MRRLDSQGSRKISVGFAAAALASAATVAVIVAKDELGLYERASGAVLWLTLIPVATWITAGLVGWWLRPTSPTGPLLTAVGLTFLLPSVLAFTGEPLLFTLAMFTWGAPFCFALHQYLVFPHDRAESTGVGRLIVLAYPVMLLPHAVETFFRDPEADYPWCEQCSPNLLLLRHDPALADAAIDIGGLVRAALLVAVGVVLVRRWRASTPAARRALAPVFGASLVAAVPFTPYLALFRPGEAIFASTLGRVALLISIVVPLAFLLGLLRTSLQRGGVADLVLELRDAPTAERVRELLGRALGDPSVELVFWRPGTSEYVDPSGGPATLPEDGGARTVTTIEHGGQRLGALIHDRSVTPELLEAVTAAAQLALDNARLQAELQAQLREVRASRGRIVEAADEERRRIERNLHDGAQQHLLAIRLALKMAGRDAGGDLEPQLSEIDSELGGALQELRTLARGLHPPILTDEGLGPALETLARRAAIPVEIGPFPSSRLPAAVETAAYYVASEGIANAVKHAHASHVRIDLTRADGRAVLEIVDDGHGGANLSGSGLRGLRDRVEALDGALTIESPPGHGTRLRVEFIRE